jgi:mono/diheme cytochrome c family protein
MAWKLIALAAGFFGFSESATAASVAIEYRLHCSGCHGAEGHGLPANGIPDLAEAGRWADTPAGRAYLVQVPGISASTMDDAMAARLLNFTLQTFSQALLPANFQAFTPEEVAKNRTGIATDAARRREALLAGPRR